MTTTNVAITDLDLIIPYSQQLTKSGRIANVLKLMQSLNELSRMVTIKIWIKMFYNNK